MTNPYLPNPQAALETSAELADAGRRLHSALEAAIGQIRAIGDPWGGDEVGNAYRESIGRTDDIQTALLGVGEGVGGFGRLATAGVGRILETDAKNADHMNISI
jgi:hypothetical protein